MFPLSVFSLACSPAEVFKSCADVILRDMVSGLGGGGLMAGLDDRSGLFQPL